MTGLGLILLVRWGSNSFTAAGTVTGAFALAEALAGPQVARLIDRRGQTRVLPWCLAIHVTAFGILIGLAASDAPAVMLAAITLLMGATLPQFGALSVARWSTFLPPGPLLTAVVALDSTVNSLAFLLGPSAVAAVSTLVHPVAGSALATTLILLGGLGLVLQRGSAPPPARKRAGEPPRRHGSGTHRSSC
jgi:MFS family permease